MEVLRAALNLGIQPADATLKALLACCADLESRPGKTALGLAAGPGFQLDGVGYVDLEQVLRACREALQQQGDPTQAAAAPATLGMDPAASSSRADDMRGLKGSLEGVQGAVGGRACTGAVEPTELAAQLLRTWVFESTFGYVEGVRQHGPTWPLRHTAQPDMAGPDSQGDTEAQVSVSVGG